MYKIKHIIATLFFFSWVLQNILQAGTSSSSWFSAYACIVVPLVLLIREFVDPLILSHCWLISVDLLKASHFSLLLSFMAVVYIFLAPVDCCILWNSLHFQTVSYWSVSFCIICKLDQVDLLQLSFIFEHLLASFCGILSCRLFHLLTVGCSIFIDCGICR